MATHIVVFLLIAWSSRSFAEVLNGAANERDQLLPETVAVWEVDDPRVIELVKAAVGNRDGAACKSVLMVVNARSVLRCVRLHHDRIVFAATSSNAARSFTSRRPGDVEGQSPTPHVGSEDDHHLVFYTTKERLGSVSKAKISLVREAERPNPISNASSASVWILYDVWHSYASNAIRQQRASVVTSVETILQSNGTLLLENVYTDGGTAAASFYYHTTPDLGAYCLYRKRPAEPTGVLPDCLNITNTATRHAELLLGLGVDVAVVDGTNLGTYDDFSDALQLRPMEVLAEEWFALRQRGISTPALVAWNCLPTGANLWQYYLDNIYNDANLTQLVARDPASGKMIFFVPFNPTIVPDHSLIAAVESNGGKNNVMVVRMWADLPPREFVRKDIWTFMAPCSSPSTGGYTTSVADLTSCNQLLVPATPLGSMMSVSPAYQLGYGSLPFQSPGKQNTWTMQLQFDTALSSGVDNILLSSFNEFIAQPQANPYPAGVASMGLVCWDPMASSLWVDTFGGSFARDIEPSKEFGSATYDLAQSCMTLLRLMEADRDRFGTTRLSACQDPALQSESCCQAAAPRQNIWSLQTVDSTDFLLTNNVNEKNDCVNSGAWVENCNAFPGPTAFCVDNTLTSNQLWLNSGPFLLATAPDLWTGPGNAIYRCRTTGGTHFFSLDPHCEGQITEYLLGYSAVNRSSEFPRKLRRCYDVSQNGLHFPSLDAHCPEGHQESIFGYVH